MSYAIPLNAELQQVSDIVFSEPIEAKSFSWFYDGVVFPVRPETRGSRIYWYMRKMIEGELHNIYVAPAGKLEAALLNNAAAAILGTASPVQPQ